MILLRASTDPAIVRLVDVCQTVFSEELGLGFQRALLLDLVELALCSRLVISCITTLSWYRGPSRLPGLVIAEPGLCRLPELRSVERRT